MTFDTYTSRADRSVTRMRPVDSRISFMDDCHLSPFLSLMRESKDLTACIVRLLPPYKND